MFRRSLLFSLAALMLATPAVAQRYQDSHNRPDHRRGFDPQRGGHDPGRGDGGRGGDGRRGDWRGDGRGDGRSDGRRFNDDRNNDGRNDGRGERTWRQQQSDPGPDSRFERPPPDRSRYPQGSGQRPPDRPREVQLPDILRNLRGQYGGQHLDAQRSGENYVIPWLSRDGRRMTVVVDAATGRVISVR